MDDDPARKIIAKNRLMRAVELIEYVQRELERARAEIDAAWAVLDPIDEGGDSE